MKSFDRPNTCPYCGTEMDAVTNVTNQRAPKEGDITLCGSCMEPSRFDDRLRMVKVNWNDLPPDHARQLRLVAQAWATIRRNRS